MKIVSLTSGGIDSFVMASMLQEKGMEIHPLFINYGQLAYEREYDSFIKVCKYLNLKPTTVDIYIL